MPDCDADPAVMAQARSYTRRPQHFEQEMRTALPKLVYVQQIAAEHDVPGEFALLPWIESNFHPVPGRRGSPAGMWQITPATARAMGLHVDRHYDGRLDVKNAADAVMKTLRNYYDDFHDWRIADYAYNAGAYGMRKLVDKHGLPPETPAVPQLPVRKGTREHLVKLLAMACVVREPARFNVSLPALPADQHLVSVSLPHSMPLARAANHAGMSLDHLKHLNAGFRTYLADASVDAYLVMPAGPARRFSDAMASGAANASDDASADTPAMGIGASDDASVSKSTPAARTARTHRVKAGESLWQVARRYTISVQDLQRWNHLRGDHIKPGQTLKLSASH